MPHAHASGFPPRMSVSPQHGEGQALALRGREAVFRLRNPPVTVARGPVPRDCPLARSMARDRPSPYAEGGRFSIRNRHVTVARGPSDAIRASEVSPAVVR